MPKRRNSSKIEHVARRPGSRGTIRGFTLLELLVAIIILTLVMTVLFGAVRLSSRSYEAGVQLADASDEKRSVVDFLRRQFAQLMPVAKGIEQMQFSFAGDDAHIRFVASAPLHSSAAGLIVYALSAEEQAEKQRLVLSYGAFDPGSSDPIDSDFDKQLILADHLSSISFQFFGAKPATQSRPAWHDAWLGDEDGLPELVRITISANNSDHWPELIFRIRAEERS